MGRIVETFDQFLQQAGLAQMGDPNLFAESKKKKSKKDDKTSPKSKSKAQSK